jgi:beta-glucosidase
MISGGGSAQVDPPGWQCDCASRKGATHWQDHIWFPTSPLRALRAKLPNAKIEFNPGQEPSAAAAMARSADVAIVFAYSGRRKAWIWQPRTSDNQEALIEQVGAANPHTIVVLETGTAVTMPWIGKVMRRGGSMVRGQQRS